MKQLVMMIYYGGNKSGYHPRFLLLARWTTFMSMEVKSLSLFWVFEMFHEGSCTKCETHLVSCNTLNREHPVRVRLNYLNVFFFSDIYLKICELT